MRSACAVDALTTDDARYVLRVGDRRLLAENVVIATGVMQKPHVPSFAPELDPRVTTAPLQRLPESRPSSRTGRCSSSARATRARTSPTRLRRSTTRSSPASTRGQIPARVDTRRGRMGFRLLFFAGSHILTMDTPIGPQDATSHPARGRTAPPVPAQGASRRRCRADDRANGRCPRRDARARRRPRRRRRGTSSGAPGSGPTSRGSTCRSRRATTAIPCSTAASSTPLPGSTSSVCSSSTPSRRCWSAGRARTRSGLRRTSSSRRQPSPAEEGTSRRVRAQVAS